MGKLLKNKYILGLLGVFLVALFLRIYDLSIVPFGFHRDEVINTYVGRFILLNGKDLYGNPWPLFYFNKFGDFPPILPMYIMGISTFIFGVTEFAARFPAAFFGSLTVIPVYFISLLFYKNPKYALFSSLLLAILPWHIVLSRSSGEGVLAVFSFSVGLLFLLKGIVEKKTSIVLYSFPFLLLTYFLYPSFRVLIPLIYLPSFFLTSQRKQQITIAALFILTCVATLLVASTVWGKARFIQTSVFTDHHIGETITAFSNDEGQNHAIRARIFHNKPIGTVRELVHQYTEYYSTSFLFTQGGLPFEYIIPDMGVIYLTIGLLLICGFVILSSVSVDKRIYYYFIYLLVISPVPAALTTDFTPHMHRALVMVIPIVLLTPLGLLKIEKIFDTKKLLKHGVIGIVFTLLILEAIYFWHQYYFHISSYKSTFKNDGYREIAQAVAQDRGNYKTVYMSFANLPIYYLFFSNNFHKELAGQFNTRLGDMQISQIDNIKYVHNDCPSELFQNKELQDGVLLIEDGNCHTINGIKTIKSIYRKDGTVAFREVVKK